MHHRRLFVALTASLLITSAICAAPPEELKTDEATLKAVGIGTGDAELIEFFRSNTLQDEDREKIAALIADLGSDNFKTREKASNDLLKIGRTAVALLRKATESTDAEVARRAKACLEKIEQNQQPAVIHAAARLLAARRPAATAQTLLKFAASTDNQEALESVRDALAAVAVRDGKPERVFVDALASKQPLSRWLAGEALVRAGQIDAVPVVRGLLKDADHSVRLRVGLAFADKNDKTVIPILIELLADLPREQCREIEDLLTLIALEKAPDLLSGDDQDTRKKRRDAWSEWWTKNGEAVDLAKISRKLVVTMETSLGTIKIELFQDKAPVSVKNFLQYVADKHYNGLIFHRVIPAFMIQGGGMETGLKERKARAPIKNESSNGLSNKRGTIAMARTNVSDSATSQFFINVKDNEFLDKAKTPDKVGYCVFGKVVAGMDVVDKIKNVQTGPVGGHNDVPLQDVTIKSVRIAR